MKKLLNYESIFCGERDTNRCFKNSLCCLFIVFKTRENKNYESKI